MNLFFRATRALLLAVLLLGSAFTASSVHAAPGVRANVTYQARLMDASGYPVADGVYQVRFSLYDAAVAGTRLWTAAGTTAAPTPVNVSVQDGLFTVLLGDGVTQLPFGDLNWNSDSLYLGVTIGADAEMNPRRPITAVPQAINSAQLGGMSPSSTDTFGGQSQFTINQASTTAATNTRSALDVISNGTSLTNDFILRAITNAGSPAFTITAQGVVSTTNLLVTGQNVCLADGTNCIPASEFDTLATVTARGSTTTVPLTFFGGATVSNLNVTGTATTTNLAASLVTTTQLFVAGRQVCLQDGTNCSSATTTLQAAYNNGRVLTLNDGKIQLNSVYGSADDFTFFGSDASPVIGAGETGTPNSGFDLSVLNGASTGTLFTFTDNRANPEDPTANTSYIAHIPGNDNTLIIGNATSYIQLDNDIALVASADNQLFFNQGRLEAQGNSDITNTAAYNLVDNCITCASDIIRLSSGLGQNAIHLYSDTDPNGVVNPFTTSGDLLFRSGSTAGSGTQLYVNVDGTNAGWRGLATTDMLPAGDVPMSLLAEDLVLTDGMKQIDVEGRLAFVLYNSGEWGIVDVTEPGTMIETYHHSGVPAVEGHLVGRRLYLLDEDGIVSVYDFSDPTAQVVLGTYDLGDPAMAVNGHFVVEGSTLYLGSDAALLTLNVGDPANITLLDNEGPPPGIINFTHLAVQDGFMYFTYKDIGDPNTQILTVDANNPANLSFFGTIFTGGEDLNDSEVHVSDNRLFVKGFNGSEQVINVYRLTNGMVDPSVLTVINPTGDRIDHFDVIRGRAYVSAFVQGSTQDIFQSFTSNLDGTYSAEQILLPSIHTTDNSSSPINFDIEGGYAYGAGLDGVDNLLSVVDLGGLQTRSLRATNGDFGQITVANSLNVRGAANFTNGITVDGRGVCLSDGSNCNTVDNSNIAMESHQSGEVTLSPAAFIDVEGRIAFVVLDDHTAHLYDASWPADQLEERSNLSDIVTGKLAGNRLYALDIFGELSVYDISNIDSPDFLGLLNVTGGEDVDFSAGAQLAVNGSVLYLTTTNTVRTIDIRNPSAMAVLDSEDFADGDVTHPHAAFSDGFLYFAHKEPFNIDNETTVLTAYDVRDPQNISQYDQLLYTGRDRNDTKIAVYNHKIYYQRWTGEEIITIRQLNAGLFGSSVASIDPPTSEVGHFEVSNNNVFVSGFNEGGPEQNTLYTYVSNGNSYDLESTMPDAYRTTDTDASPENFDIEGTWLIGGGPEFVIPGEYTIYAIDLGGLKTRSVFASGGDFGDMIIGNKLMVQGVADFANGITVQGLAVCLADGTGCPSSVGGADLQSAYDAGRTISLNDGHIELDGQNGSPTDIIYNGDTYTRLIGGGLSDNATTTGFDIAMTEFDATERNIALLFSNNRNNPSDPGARTSSIEHYSSDGGYQSLVMQTGSASVFTDSDGRAGIYVNGSNNGFIVDTSSVLQNNDGLFEVENYTGNYTGMSIFNNQNGNTVSLKTGTDDPNANATGTVGDIYYRGGLNGSGTQMYLNVDGTINGWKGVATTDMLSGDASMSSVSTIATAAFSNRLNVQNGKAVSLDFGSNWELFDMSDVANPVSRYVSSTAMSIGKINDDRLYMIESSSDVLHVFDISDLSLPIVLGTIDLAGGASSDKSIDVIGSTVYVATEFGTYIVNAADPAAMTIVNTIPASGSAPLVKVMDGYLYRSAKADIFGNPTTTVEIYDIRAPLAPALLSTFDATSNIFTNNSLEISGNDLFVWGMTAPNAQPLINHYNVTDRANPVLVNQIITPGSTYWNFTAKNGSIYASNFTGSRCLDRLAYDGTVLETNCSFNNVGEIVVDGNYAYVAARLVGSGIQTIDLGGKIVHGLRASTGDFGHVSIKDDLIVGGKADFTNDISVKGVSVCLADGTNCQAGDPGLASADMSRHTLTTTLPGGPYDVDVEGRLAFVSYKFNWELYDLTNPAVPTLVYSDATPMRTAQIIGNRLYGLEDGADIIHIYDVSDPANTVQLGTFDTTSSTGDSAELTVEGSNIVLATADGLYVIDAENPASMSLLSFTALNRAYPRLAVQDGFAYYSSKPGYGILDTTTTVNVIDIRNPSAPIMAVSFDVSGRNRPDNELQIADRRLYINGRSDIGGEQINVYDISNQAAPSFVSSTNPIGEVVDHFVVNRGRLYIASFEADSTQNIFESWVINENGDLTHEQTLNPGIHTTNNNDHPELFDIDGTHAFGWGFDVGTDYLASVDLGGLSLRAARFANADLGAVSIGSSLAVRGYANFSNQITVNGQAVCLADGTNCPAASSDWIYTTSTNFLRPASSTANLVIGGTSTTVGFMNPDFTMDGNDLFVGGNIGSVSSVYTNGEFVVGNASMHIGNGYIRKTDGNITLEASGGFILPATDLGLTLGADGLRFDQGYFRNIETASLHVTGTVAFASMDQYLNDYSSSSLVTSFASGYAGATSVRITTNNNSFFISYTSSVASGGGVRSYDARQFGTNSGLINGANIGDIDGANDRVYALQTTDNSLRIYRGDYLGSSTLIGSLTGAGFDFSTSSRIVVRGNYAFIADKTTLKIVNVGNVSVPKLVNTITGAWTDGAISIDSEDIYLVVAYRAAGFVTNAIYNVSNPEVPSFVSSFGSLQALDTASALQGHKLYVLESGFNILRMRSLAGTSERTYTINDGTAVSLKVQGDYAYLLGDSLTVLNLKTGAQKTITGVGSFPYALAVGGRYVYTAGQGGYKVYDIGGIAAAAADFGSVQIGSLSVGESINVAKSLNIGGGLMVNNGGAVIEDALSVGGTSASGPIMMVQNNSVNTTDRAWGAYIDQLLIGASSTATGTLRYMALITHGATGTGLCVDDITTAATCPGSQGVGIEADAAINASAFDLAERYNASGTVAAGDLIQFADGATSTVEASHGIAYDPRAIGVISTKPGFILGWEGDAQVALAGRVPVKVTVANGVIRVGDKLTSSNVTGTAMKATRPGMTVGIALQDADADGLVEMFVQPEFSLSTAINTDGSIQFTNESGSTTFSVDAAGNGYFLGDVSATSFTTHAAFDLAERYSSPDQLERGDLVMINPNAEMQMVRTAGDSSLAIGIVSTAPGFTLGAATTDTYPIALAGRVPTKVSNMNGEIKPGDALTVSSLPGVAVKAVDAGMIVGYALQSYNGNDIGLIEVFVQAGYWKPSATYSVVTSTSMGPTYQGFAKIMDGATRVHVSFASLLAYPAPVITPMSSMPTVWRLENVTDTGFDLVIESNPGMDIVFYWQVNAVPTGIQMSKSDGTIVSVDPLTGLEVVVPAAPLETISTTSTP